MSILPVIKVELKRNLWVAWVAVLLAVVYMGGNLGGSLMSDAFDSMLDFTASYSHFVPVYGVLFTCCGWWVLLFVFVQFGRDSLLFKQALPYTDKKLLLSKFTAFLAVLGIFLAAYACVCAVLFHKFDYVFYIMRHTGPDLFGNGWLSPFSMVIAAVTAALFAAALYWFLALCCCLCRNSVHGCMLGIFFAAAAFAFNDFLSIVSDGDRPFSVLIAQWLTTVSPHAYAYTETVIWVMVSLVILAVAVPLCVKLYGGGESNHPFFRYRHTDKVCIAAAAVFFGSVGHTLLGFGENSLWLSFVIGAVFGAAAGIIINCLVKRRAAK